MLAQHWIGKSYWSYGAAPSTEGGPRGARDRRPHRLDPFGYTEPDFLSLLATSSTTPLVFGFRDDPGFLFLDDVTLDPVPEPTALILFGTTAGLGLARWRRWRHKQQQ